METHNKCIICLRKTEKDSNKCESCNSALQHMLSENKRLFGDTWYKNENYWNYINRDYHGK